MCDHDDHFRRINSILFGMASSISKRPFIEFDFVFLAVTTQVEHRSGIAEWSILATDMIQNSTPATTEYVSGPNESLYKIYENL